MIICMLVFTESWATTENKVSPVAGGALCDPVDKLGSMGWPRRKDAMKSWSLFLLFLKKYQLTYGWVDKDSGAGAQDDTILNIIHTEHGYVQYVYIYTYICTHIYYTWHMCYFSHASSWISQGLKLHLVTPLTAKSPALMPVGQVRFPTWICWASLLTPLMPRFFLTPNKISKSFWSPEWTSWTACSASCGYGFRPLGRIAKLEVWCLGLLKELKHGDFHFFDLRVSMLHII